MFGLNWFDVFGAWQECGLDLACMIGALFEKILSTLGLF